MPKRQPIHVTLTPDMVGFDCLDAYLVRQLPRKEALALSPSAKAERQRARVRVSKRKAKLRNILTRLVASSRLVERDILQLDPIILT
jgi:hypothetical protein